ncbi:MAG: PTS transporter subunit EIIC [Holdemanella sp.]|nr:PTS transporter subunit EIIC [Holdemanella sp.]
MAKYTDFCNEILAHVGGKDNVSAAVHCMTRLRLTLKDKALAEVENVKNIKGVLGAQWSGEQFQIIIGQHVSDVYPEFCSIAGIAAGAAIDENLDKEPFSIKKVPSKILDAISGSMAPVLPVMMASGFFKLFYSLLGSGLLAVLPDDHAFMVTLNLVGTAGLYFLPIYVAYGAAQKFKTNVSLALMLAGLLLAPDFIAMVTAGEPFKVYGLLNMPLLSYGQSFLPPFLAVWIMSYVYGFINKIMPQSIKIIGVPFCTMFIMVPILYCVCGPLGNAVGTVIASGITILHGYLGPVVIALIAAFWPFCVATGMHIAIIQIALINITTIGYDPLLLPATNIANYALMGMAVAYLIRAKGEERQLASANCITLIVGGISEPTLFTILLRNKKAMACQIIGGFVGGLVGGFFNLGVYTLGASNFLTVLQYAGGPDPSNFTKAIIACAIAFVVALAVGIVLGFGEVKEGEGLGSFVPKKKKA